MSTLSKHEGLVLAHLGEHAGDEVQCTGLAIRKGLNLTKHEQRSAIDELIRLNLVRRADEYYELTPTGKARVEAEKPASGTIHTNISGDVSDSQIATGSGISQTYQKTVGVDSEALADLFAQWHAAVAKLPEDEDPESVAQTVQGVEAQVEKLQDDETDEKAQTFLERRLTNLANMAPDIGDVVIASLVNPAAGVAMVVKNIAERVQQKLKGESE